MKLGVSIVYSSIDSFLWVKLREQVEAIADYAIVVRRSHLLCGEVEPLPNLGMTTLTLPAFEGDPQACMRQMRLEGVRGMPPSITHVLLLDSDELFEPNRLKAALRDVPTYFAADWYWRVGFVKAVQQNEVAGLLCRKDKLVDQGYGDREALCLGIQRPRAETPFMHHYSWCKPLDQMIRKVRNWGHRDDRPWESMLLHEWRQPLPGTCFVHKNRPLVRCTDIMGIRDPA